VEEMSFETGMEKRMSMKIMNWDARNYVNVNDRPIKTRILLSSAMHVSHKLRRHSTGPCTTQWNK